MPRAPIQVIVLPYRVLPTGGYEFAVFHRAQHDMWQVISGGAEDDETPLEAASRELFEEAGTPIGVPLTRLDSIASVPRKAFPNTSHWPASLFVVPEYAFAVNVTNYPILLSSEHSEFAWLGYKEAFVMLTWESNRTALWELKERLKSGMPTSC